MKNSRNSKAAHNAMGIYIGTKTYKTRTLRFIINEEEFGFG
jgi:hypothetical protein